MWALALTGTSARMNQTAANGGQVGIAARLCTGLAAVAVLLLPCLARAQYVPDYFPTGVPGYNQDMGVTVVTRVRPLYAQPGIRAGSFTITPTLNESTGYNSNVVGLSGGPGSWFVETNPSVQIQSDWSRDSLGASFSADNFLYPDTPAQNATNWQAAIGGAYTIGRGNLTLAYGHFSLNERPTDVGAPPSSAPIPYTVDDVRGDYTFDLGRLKITPDLDFSLWRFGNTTIPTGNPTIPTGDPTILIVPSDQSFRNRNVVLGGTTFRYELSGETSLLLVMQGTTSQFIKPEPGLFPPLSSSSAMALGGIDYQYDGVWRYQLLAGVEVRTFVALAFATRTSPILQGTVIWTPSGLTTVTASALRTISDPTTEGSSGSNDTRLQLRVDHEYLRNVLLDGEAGVENAAYFQGGAQSGYYVGGGITWLINRNLRLSARYQFTERSSSSAVAVTAAGTVAQVGGPYNQNLFTLQLTFGL